MDSSVKIGVVTVTYNSGQVIEAFMESLVGQSQKNYVLYVVDNASMDDTLGKLVPYEQDLSIVLIPNQKNIGVAAGNNQGIKQALADSCTHVLLINNDIEFEPQLFSKLLAGMEAVPCEMVVPKILYHDEPQKIWFAGGHFDNVKTYVNIHEGYNEIDLGQYDQSRMIQYAPTCCMLIKPAVFEKVGLMDEKYFVYYDDTDFCIRALQQKQKLYYHPDATLYHKVSSLTGGGESDFALTYYMRNKVYFIRKHIPFPLSYLFLAMTQCKLFVDGMFGKGDKYRLKQHAFWEGLRL
jgi:GT2 family glycosyltransferase